MKKIATLNLNAMQTEEFFGYLKLVKEETALLTNETVKPTVDAFAAAYTAFDEALKDSASTPGTALAAEKDNQRDFAYRGLAATVKASAQYYPDTAIRAQAQQVKDLLDKYGDPTQLAQTTESGILHNLLQDLAALDSKTLTDTGLKLWVDALAAREDEFLAAVQQRTTEEAARVKGIVQQTRTEAETAYRQLVDVVNALFVLNPKDTSYETFIDHLNALIERQKTVLKTRATTNAKRHGSGTTE